jgi:spore germination protein GerM
MKATTHTIRLAAGAVLLALFVVGCAAGVGSAGTVGPRPATESPGAVPTPTVEPTEPTPAGTPATPAPSRAPGSTASPRPTARPTASTAATRKIALKAYFLLYADSSDDAAQIVPAYRQVEQTQAVATAAMKALLAGPTDQERAHDLRVGTLGTAIPERTLLLGINIQNGLATVDLSREFGTGGDLESMALRMGQVVYTLTQFPTVDRVAFRLDGRPIKAIEGHEGTGHDAVGRDAYLDQLPAIFVDSPAWGAPAASVVVASGKANVFEAQFMAALVRWTPEGDRILVQRSVMATCGTGCWGDFQVRFSVPSSARGGELHLRVWEPSAQDGRPVNVVEYPLR